nr:hypothetical protein MFLOJ_39670 [Mycobacterium florentinum]
MPVGISGFGGSPPFTTTSSGLSAPPPQPASDAADSTTTAAKTALPRIQRMTATLGPARATAAEGCNDHESVMRVVQRIDGSTDTSGCPDGVKGVGYPTPPLVYCLQRAVPY